ncbi:uncharacterized protein STEHIDRAFT_156866 [Stereum hirsutum FP-91666 SS1]|uniref:uncharacterized protein n=1 Tax=Stereum hirsutum (strain FP-91666) TaxID=721885 RepID=UPI00044106E4|nr:uncharacterized protein STEHIDRAFT_156866 [Stereum hirsutum FP-91666 SS1]EIM86558.1 hypothetical protein STEHIDRAFT_156866 [Stereum hirsutum FP-91666 SS1]
MQHTDPSSGLLNSLYKAGLGLREQWKVVAAETSYKDSEERRQKMASLNTSIEQTVNLTAQLPMLRDSISALRAENALLRSELSSLPVRFKQPPPEILRMIFGFATSAPFSDPAVSHGPNSLWCQTMRTKKAVMLVCKLWRDVGAEFLYEDVVLRRPAQPALLLRTLETPGIDYGHRISSLWLTCVTEPSDYDDLCRVLGGILSVSTRIKSFGLVNPFEYRPQDAGILVHDWSTMLNLLAHSPCSACLTHLKLAVTGDTLVFDPCFMQNFPNLSSLDIDASRAVVNNQTAEEFPSRSQIHLPELRHIRCTKKGYTSSAHLHVLSSIISNPCSLLQLNMLTIGFSDYSRSASHLREIFRLCGPQLTYLHLIEHDSPVPFGYHNLQEFMDYFPKLEHLVVPIRLVETYRWSHPTLRWLDVWTTFSIRKRFQPRTYLPSLTLYRQRCPNLIAVRKLDIDLSYRSIDIPIRLPPDTTFPPGVRKRTFDLSNTSDIVQTSHKIILKEIGYIFDAPPVPSSDESEDSSSDKHEDSSESDEEWLNHPTDSEESSADSDGTDSSSMVSADG